MNSRVSITPESTRIDGVDGEPFVLSDGRAWHLARPKLRFRPVFSGPVEPAEAQRLRDAGETVAGDGVRCEVVAVWSYGRTSPLDEIVAGLIARFEAECTVADFLAGAVGLAVALLRLCHRVPGEAAAELLDLSAGEAETLAVGVLRMVRGQEPFPESEEPGDASKEV